MDAGARTTTLTRLSDDNGSTFLPDSDIYCYSRNTGSSGQSTGSLVYIYTNNSTPTTITIFANQPNAISGNTDVVSTGCRIFIEKRN